MDFSSAAELLEKLETSNVIAYLQNLDLQELIHNPYILGGTAGLAILCLWMRWRVLLALLLSLSGFIWLLSYTLAQDTSMEGGVASDTLFVFVIGGAAIVFLTIYLLFIRSD